MEGSRRQDRTRGRTRPGHAADFRHDEGCSDHTRNHRSHQLWAGTVIVQPDARIGPHHHGELETVLYIVKGRARICWGDHLEFSEEAGAGDFIYVPPYVPHQEINAREDESCEAVVVRSGQNPKVVNLGRIEAEVEIIEGFVGIAKAGLVRRRCNSRSAQSMSSSETRQAIRSMGAMVSA